MSASYDRGNFGDSANRLEDVKQSTHIFDGTGEHLQYHSDSESTSSNNSRRYINPAICVEKLESAHSVSDLNDDTHTTPHPHTTHRSNSTPFLSVRDSACSVRRISCNLDLNIQGNDDGDSTVYGTTYREHGSDTFRLSVASLSTTTTTKEDRAMNEQKKREAFKQWMAKKEQERKEKIRREKLRQQPAKVISEEEREESYRRWLEQKRIQSERRKAEMSVQQYRLNENIERERAKRENAKEEKLTEWVRKKEEEMKKMKTREERAAARAAIENEKRRVNGQKAYRDWLRTSKNKPLPVPLNQGELSMRGTVSDMYINPVPWKSLI